jgi:malate synthase
MEDAATAEICRSQIWQWLRHGAKLDDGRTVNEALVRSLLDEEVASLRRTLGQERFAKGHFAKATELFLDIATAPVFVDFLTEPAYRELCAAGG